MYAILYLKVKKGKTMISKTAKYFVTFSKEDEMIIAEKFEELLKRENISANAKLKELIIQAIKES